ncbi:hypothetical protein HDU76_002009 [Blyttiomyces sp. JEL0837]|nr:hypothetical protein HDU76_002009 [Blyttiomyces sp. JEL0837]
MPSSTDIIITSAPGKVILFGEHAVVYGKTAIAASLDLRSYACIKPRTDGKVKLTLPDVNIDEEWTSDELEPIGKLLHQVQTSPTTPTPLPQNAQKQFKDVVDTLLTDGAKQAAIAVLYMYLRLCDKMTGVDISVRSALPVGAGLGSSASFSVCIASGLLMYAGHISSTGDASLSDADTNLVNDWAFISEKVIHGNPSGIDNSICSFGGAKMYARGKPLDSVEGFSSMQFLLTNTRFPKDTRVQVEKVKTRTDEFPEVMGHLMNSAQAISDSVLPLFSALVGKQADKATMDNIYRKMEVLIDVNHCIMAACGVSHETLEKVRQITGSRGLYSKLTGAGGGGCALTLVREDTPKDTVIKVKEALQKQGFDCFETSVGGKGVLARQVTDNGTTASGFLSMKWEQLGALLE